MMRLSLLSSSRVPTLCLVACSVPVLIACGGPPAESKNVPPPSSSTYTVVTYDGVKDDLLTAGLGKSGLVGAPPSITDPAKPSAVELRRLAIYRNYRGLIDPTPAGGFGVLYGPNIDIKGGDTLGEGKIAGKEYIAYSDDGSGKQNVTMMVQVPANFSTSAPCIVTATAAGSSGIYSAISTAGEWGLKHGCAVAYTDKGAGNAFLDLQNNVASLIDGTLEDASKAGKNAALNLGLSDEQRGAFNRATPNRVALKHAHSQQNSEKDWGRWTLKAIDFAYFVLNEQFSPLGSDGKTHLLNFTSKNTIVIASSVSNGAGAALAALEQDSTGLISGLAVSEPNVQLAPDTRLNIVRGNSQRMGTGRPLYDYITLANQLQPCAALAPAAANAPLRAGLDVSKASARCVALRNQGLISGNSVDELGASAQAALLAAGYQPESRDLHAAMYQTATPAVAITYANAYGKFSVLDNLCGFSFGADASKLPLLFGQGSGIAPTTGITVLNNNSVGGAVLDGDSISANGVKDFNADGARCLRDLVGSANSSDNAKRVQAGMADVVRSANLRGKPAIIVHGRADTLIPVNFTSRPYWGMNKLVEGSSSRLSYIEVTNAQHFDAFIPFAGFDSRYVPLHVYFNQAMDMIYANLRGGAALPISQVVRTTPRALDATGKVLPLAAKNVPAISLAPNAADIITFNNNTVTVPD